MATVRAPKRLQTYSLIIGTVIGLLVAGLGVPFVFGHRIGQGVSVASGNSSLGVLGGSTQGGTAAVGGTPGSVAGAGTGGVGGGPAATPGAGSSGAPGLGSLGQPGGVSGPVGSAQAGPTAAATSPGLTTEPVSVGPSAGATDVGVTATTIKIGVGLADTGGLNQFGFAGAPTQAATTAWTDLFNYINKHGGVDGRSLVPDFVYYNALDYNSMESACLKWTVDDKVFAVINSGGLYGPPVLCVSRDHKTPFMTNDQEDASYFNASNGMLVTTQASAERLVANLAYFSNEIGALKGQKIGIFDADGDFREAVTMGLIPVLKSLGYNITDEETISATDVNEIPPQAQVAVENMRSKGVTTVLMVHNFLADSLFVQDADKQLYHPQYLESEWGGLMGPGSTNEMPQSFQGAIGFYGGNEDTQQASAPVPVGDEQCAAIYNSTQSPGNQFGPGTGGFDGLMGGCNMLNIFVAAARNVGPDLTRQAWAGAVGHLGSFTMDGGPPASFGTEYGIKAWSPLKDDGSDYVREVTWQYSCTCWLPVGKSSFVRDAY